VNEGDVLTGFCLQDFVEVVDTTADDRDARVYVRVS
jgi:hypothetical protein